MLLFGMDSAKSVLPLLVDSTGRAIVVPNNLAGVTPYTRLLSFSLLTLAAGTSEHTVGTVTAGEVWQVDQLMLRYTGTVAGVSATVRQMIAGVLAIHMHAITFTSAIWQIKDVDLLTDGGTVWSSAVLGATLNDDLEVRVFGRRVQ